MTVAAELPSNQISRLGVKTGVEMSNLAGAAIGVAAIIKDHLFS